MSAMSSLSCQVGSTGKYRWIRSIKCGATVGVDLGTCQSAIARLDKGRPEPILLPNGSYTMTSAVSCTEEGLVALPVMDAAIDVDHVLSGVKRLMGRDFDDVKEELMRSSCVAVCGEDGGVQFLCPPLVHPVKPEEVSSVVLMSLFQAAEDVLQGTIDRAVITMPSYFGVRQKAATIEAAGMAGVENVALLQEPIAAALSYGLGRSMDEDLVLVIDVGGGTFDVSVLSIFDGIMEVVSYAGDQHLGGQDFDRVIADWILTELNQTKSLTDVELKMSVLASAERAKIDVVNTGITHFSFGNKAFHLTLDAFNQRTRHLAEMFLPPILEAGEAAMIDWINRIDEDNQVVSDLYRPPPKHITQVVLAGGSSSLPALQSTVTQLTGLSHLKCPVDPKLCVACGAAIFGGMLEGEIGGIELMDGAYSNHLHDRISGFQSS